MEGWFTVRVDLSGVRRSASWGFNHQRSPELGAINFLMFLVWWLSDGYEGPAGLRAIFPMDRSLKFGGKSSAPPHDRPFDRLLHQHN